MQLKEDALGGQVYRFRDRLVIYLRNEEGSQTTYLTLTQAKQVRAAMGRVIRSIERESFVESNCTAAFNWESV